MHDFTNVESFKDGLVLSLQCDEEMNASVVRIKSKE